MTPSTRLIAALSSSARMAPVHLGAAGAENGGNIRLAERQPQIGAFGQLRSVDLFQGGEEEARYPGMQIVKCYCFQPVRSYRAAARRDSG